MFSRLMRQTQAADMAMLSKRVHDSLPEFDITSMVQVSNPALASKYADCRHRLAARCNGNPNERIVFHFASDFVIPKIWQEGERHDPRLSLWAEVGKSRCTSQRGRKSRRGVSAADLWRCYRCS